MSGFWDDLISEDSTASGRCESGDWESQATGQECKQLVREASEHMEKTGHVIKVDLEL